MTGGTNKREYVRSSIRLPKCVSTVVMNPRFVTVEISLQIEGGRKENLKVLGESVCVEDHGSFRVDCPTSPPCPTTGLDDSSPVLSVT